LLTASCYGFAPVISRLCTLIREFCSRFGATRAAGRAGCPQPAAGVSTFSATARELCADDSIGQRSDPFWTAPAEQGTVVPRGAGAFRKPWGIDLPGVVNQRPARIVASVQSGVAGGTAVPRLPPHSMTNLSQELRPSSHGLEGPATRHGHLAHVWSFYISNPRMGEMSMQRARTSSLAWRLNMECGSRPPDGDRCPPTPGRGPEVRSHILKSTLHSSFDSLDSKVAVSPLPDS